MDLASDFHKEILDSVDDGVWVSDHEDRIVFCNAAMRRIAGVELDAIIGLSVIEDFPEATTGKFLPHYFQARDSLRPVSYESEVVTPAGRHSVQAGSLSPLLEDGRFAGMICTIQDATQTRHVERDLIEAGNRARRFLDIAPSIILALDREGIVTLLNQQGGRVLGCDPDEAIGANWFDAFLPPRIRQEVRQVFEQLLAGDVSDVEDYENEVITRDGRQTRLVQWHNTLLKDEEGTITGLLCSGQDVTQQRRMERELRRSQSIIDSTTDVIITTDLSGTMTSANTAVEELYGYTPKQLVGRPVSMLWREENLSQLEGSIDTLVAGQSIESLETTCIDRGGHDVPVLMSLVGLRDSAGNVIELLGVVKGIQALREARKALELSEERLRGALDGSPYPIAVVDEQDQNIVFWSESARQLFGHTPKTTSEWYSLAYPDPGYRKTVLGRWNQLLDQARSSGEAINTGEYQITCKDGSVRTCELYARFIPGNLIVTMNDVSEQKRTAKALAESESKYRTLVQNMQQGVVIAQADPVRLRFANPAMSTITGYEETELLAMGEDQLPGLIHADDRPRFFDSFRIRIAGDDVPPESEYRIVRKDGTTRWVSIYSSLIDYLGEKATLTTFVDRSEQREAEVTVREINLRIRNAVEAGRIGLWDWNLLTNETYYSPEWKAQIGYTDEEINDSLEEWKSRVHPDELEAVISSVRDAIAQRSQRHVTEFRFRHKDGSYRWILAHASILTNDRGDAVRMLGSHIDITDRKDAEDSLRRSEALFRKVFEILPVGLWIADKRGTLLQGNPAGQAIWGGQPLVDQKEYGVFKARRLPSREEIPPDDWALAHTVNEGVTISDELLEIDAFDGVTRSVLNYTAPVLDESGEVEAAIVVNQDITKQYQAETELREAERRNRALLDHSPVCHKVVDLNLNLRYMSKNGFCMLKLDEDAAVYGEPYPFDFFPKAFRDEMMDKLKAVLATGKIATMQALASDIEGNDVWLHSTLIPVHNDTGTLDYITVVSADVTAQRLLEARLRQSQKLESIGTLASGVAHEINNPLMGILNYAELLKDDVSANQRRQFASGIIREGDRVAVIVRNLLSFARRNTEPGSLACIRDLIDASLVLIETALRKDGIQIEIDIPDDLPRVVCRSQQIQQVIINLLTNARDALNQRYTGSDEGKRLCIASHTVEKRGDRWLRTTVEDHGVGIPKDLVQRIFDPFFTTKPRNQGTGLGLSVSYGIIESHNGKLWAESELGEYTRFHIDLPITTA